MGSGLNEALQREDNLQVKYSEREADVKILNSNISELNVKLLEQSNDMKDLLCQLESLQNYKVRLSFKTSWYFG